MMKKGGSYTTYHSQQQSRMQLHGHLHPHLHARGRFRPAFRTLHAHAHVVGLNHHVRRRAGLGVRARVVSDGMIDMCGARSSVTLTRCSLHTALLVRIHLMSQDAHKRCHKRCGGSSYNARFRAPGKKMLPSATLPSDSREIQQSVCATQDKHAYGLAKHAPRTFSSSSRPLVCSPTDDPPSCCSFCNAGGNDTEARIWTSACQLLLLRGMRVA